jgi:DNA repair exonuclease SbcCD ATPase subunit
VKEYIEKVNKVSNKIQQLIGKRDSIVTNINTSQKQENGALLGLDKVTKAKTLLELFVRSTEVQIKEYIEPTITEALQFIFKQNLYFHIIFVNRRGQVEIDFIVLPNTEVENQYQKYSKDNEKKELEELIDSYVDIVYNNGGSVGEVLGLILRLLLIELLQIQGPVVLDEPTSAAPEEYATRIGVFIKSLSERFNRQIIYVTHSKALASAANKVYEITKDKDISKVEEI